MAELCKEDREKALGLVSKLNGAFPWDETPQGFAFWQNVAEQLRNLGEKEPEICPCCEQEIREQD